MTLLRCRSAREALAALQRREPIVFRENGSRMRSPSELVPSLLPVARAVGVTRIWELPSLLDDAFHVFQSVRDNLSAHPVTGQSAHAEGKGRSRDQALVSCLMESIEKFCVEPDASGFVRASYDELRRAFDVADPNAFVLNHGVSRIPTDAPLVWTEVADVRRGREVWIPAEAVFFPFGTASYGTGSAFPSGTNGLASGTTVLEAVVHAITELLERMYDHAQEDGRARIEAFRSGIWRDDAVVALEGRSDYELQVHALRCIDAPEDLPMVAAYLVGEDAVFMGRACGLDIEDVVVRAISEVVQAEAVTRCGSRDHAGIGRPAEEEEQATVENANEVDDVNPSHPRERTLDVASFDTEVPRREFADLGSELEFLVSWLGRAGYEDVYVANLTRIGVDVPVVKVVVPGLPMSANLIAHGGPGWDHVMVEKARYGGRP